jgi:phosphate butyryltransferase
MQLRKVEDLISYAREKHPAVRVACAAADDRESLESLRLALDAGIALPVAVGEEGPIRDMAAAFNISLDGFEIDAVSDSAQAAVRAVELVRNGRAAILMKGHLTTKTLIQAALSRDGGLRGVGMLSHVALFDNLPLGKMLALTDAGINVRPNFSQKIEIVKNAADVMRRLGIPRPKVAMLAAIEKVELPAMPATVEAKLIERMGQAGLLGNLDIQGPLSLDAAISSEAAKSKELGGPVAGQADIVVAPEIEAGNMLYKAIAIFAGQDAASLVWGRAVPWWWQVGPTPPTSSCSASRSLRPFWRRDERTRNSRQGTSYPCAKSRFHFHQACGLS